MYQINDLNLEQKIGLKKTMTRVECITPIVKLNLKLRRQVYAIIVMRTYLLKYILVQLKNAKLWQKLKSGFKRMISWNKYQSKATIQAGKQYLH